MNAKQFLAAVGGWANVTFYLIAGVIALAVLVGNHNGHISASFFWTIETGIAGAVWAHLKDRAKVSTVAADIVNAIQAAAAVAKPVIEDALKEAAKNASQGAGNAGKGKDEAKGPTSAVGQVPGTIGQIAKNNISEK